MPWLPTTAIFGSIRLNFPRQLRWLSEVSAWAMRFSLCLFRIAYGSQGSATVTLNWPVESLMKQNFQWINYVLNMKYLTISVGFSKISFWRMLCFSTVSQKISCDLPINRNYIRIPHVSYQQELYRSPWCIHEDTRPRDVSRKPQNQIPNTTTRYRIKSHHLGWWPFQTSIAVPNRTCCWTDCGRIL